MVGAVSFLAADDKQDPFLKARTLALSRFVIRVCHAILRGILALTYGPLDAG